MNDIICIGLLRHFPTSWNAQGRLQGRTDIPLSEASLAELQTRSLPKRWQAVPVWCSPLVRARQTAHALAPEADLAIDERLIEMDFGDWEGKVGKELLADPASGYKPVEYWGWDYKPPSGETPKEMLARLQPALADIAAAIKESNEARSGEPAAILVVHRGVMRCLLAAATGWQYDGPETFRIKRAALHPLWIAKDGTPVAADPFEKLDFC